MIFAGMIPHRHKYGVTFWPATSYVCAECEDLFFGEWFILKRAVWEQAWPGTAMKSAHDPMPRKHFLCIGCVEAKIGRRLTRRDFDMRRKAHTLKHNSNMSLRMRRRLGIERTRNAA